MYSIPEALTLAADLIDKGGLWQGEDDGTGTCAANALYRVMGEDATATRPARKVLADYLGLDDPVCGVFKWNDEAADKSVVVDAMRAAAVATEAAAIITAAEQLDVLVVSK